jgi:tRNA A-37 threonylcarbamoyl transferase component Bud32/membrane protein YdbS with pleckstrin-like domain
MNRFEFTLSGRYRLLAPLGEGGMASVYAALDQRLGRRVAIKLLAENLLADPEFVQRFQHEAEYAAKLSHPNLVSVYDVGEDGGQHYIVMELVVGRNLKDIIGERGPLPIDRIVAIAGQVLDGLAFAHEHGLIHRDIKPQNILVARDGTAKLADFGIARAVNTSSATQTAVVLGSAHYLSPEQARGEAVTKQSDIYSFGVVLYEMATGRVPFEGSNLLAIATKHIHDVPVPPSAINKDLPPALNECIMRALAKDPLERYGTATELKQGLLSASVTVETTRVFSPSEEHAAQQIETVPLGRDDDDRQILRPTLVHHIFRAIWVSLAAPLLYLAFSLWPGLVEPHWLVTARPWLYLLGGALAVFIAVLGVLERVRYRYIVDRYTVSVETGILGRQRDAIPLGAIASLRLHQSPLARILGVGTIELLTMQGPGGRISITLHDVAHATTIYDLLVQRISTTLRRRPDTVQVLPEAET